jgi:hypothetical protein
MEEQLLFIDFILLDLTLLSSCFSLSRSEIPETCIFSKSSKSILSTSFVSLLKYSSVFSSTVGSSFNSVLFFSVSLFSSSVILSELSPFLTQLQKETVATKDTTNLQDMAKFLMDSWQDEVGDEGQFDDASVQTSLSKGDNSDRITDDEKRETLKNNTELKDDPTVEEKTEEYFNRLCHVL